MWYLEFLTCSPIQEHTFPLRFWIGGVKADSKIFGRKANVRLTCPNASRLHATLQVQAEGETEYLTVVDQSSHGTFVVRADMHLDLQKVEKLDKGFPVRLNPGDRIAFGRPGAWYFVGKEKLVIYVDKTPEREYYLLKETCDKVGLTITSTWNSEVSILLMNELMISPWLCIALVRGIPMVHSGWIERVKQVVLNSAEQVGLITVPDLATSYTQLPSTESYFPRRSDIFTKEEISTVVPYDSSRQYLFSNRKFVINCDEQTELWESVIASAGGQLVKNEQDADYVVLCKRNIGQTFVTSRKMLTIHQITVALLQANTQIFDKYDLEEPLSSPVKNTIDSDAETDEEKDSSNENTNLDGVWKSDRDGQQPSKTSSALLPSGVWLKRNRSSLPDDQMKGAYNKVSFIEVSFPVTKSLRHLKKPKPIHFTTISCNEMKASNSFA
ncbi:hypothetical protein Gasu2_46750 [Galdieria sulphuraria]|nr:hypothetical protein Gasu2_46750 [Galdieria sulphuraria]